MNFFKKHLTVLLLITCLHKPIYSQLSNKCKLNIGTNLSLLTDWGTELPFVDLMHSCREWYTKSVGDPTYQFNSGFADSILYDSNGYPTHLPQTITASTYPQIVATIWGATDGWLAGAYTLLWDGIGTLSLSSPGITNLTHVNNNKITFDFLNPVGKNLELVIEASDISNPLTNIRLLMPGTEMTYQTKPFNQLWLDKLSPFNAVRFMNWGSINGWGQIDQWTIGDGILADWSERSKMGYYTWTHSKGIPYEIMIQLMNQLNIDGWVCIPHKASENYVRNMARLFRDNLEVQRQIYVEYSNELWNWIFGQTSWIEQYGCVIPGEIWPECTTPFIENALTYWSDEFIGKLNRTTRVVAVQTGWLDVAQRVVYNINTDIFDAISPTYYFNLGTTGDNIMDNLGATATVQDLVSTVRNHMPTAFSWIQGIKTISDSLNKPLVFYEGGQHITPEPFGEPPSYSTALIDIQRDTTMYNMYNEWYDLIRTLQVGNEPLLLMNYSFVGGRSAQYGSWGILETLDQDTSLIPAPKYRATIENMNTNCQTLSISDINIENNFINIYPNPITNNILNIVSNNKIEDLKIIDIQGRIHKLSSQKTARNKFKINTSTLSSGIYLLTIKTNEGLSSIKIIIKK